MESDSLRRASPRFSTIAGSGLLWLGPLLLAGGVVHYRMWEQLPSMRALEGLGIAAVALACAWLARRLFGVSLAGALAAFWSLCLVLFAGPVPTLATLILAGAALALGSAISSREAAGLQLALGLVVIAGTIGWLLPLPLHWGLLYLGLALAAIFLRRRVIMRSLRRLGGAWSRATREAPASAAFAVLVLGLASTGAWLPTMQFDDLAYHLRLPWQLQLEGRYLLDPSTQVWALAPWASDVVHAMAQLIGRAEARGPVNAMWLAIAAGGLWRLGRALNAPARVRWLTIALFGSFPLTATLVGSMHTELPTTALLAWLLALVVERRTPDWPGWLAVVLLAAGLTALKLTAAVLAALLLLIALVRFPWPPPRRIAALALLFALVAGSSYTYAMVIAGNPFLPLFNGWFHSPYFKPENMLDARWATGFGPTLLWDMTFRTHDFNESYAGSAGFAVLALAGAVALALVRPGARLAMGLSLALLFVPLLALQYLRYAFPGMVLVTVVAAIATMRWQPRLGAAVVVLVCAANLAFQASAQWMMREGAVRLSVARLGADRPVFETYMPERVLMRQLRKAGSPSGTVIFLDDANPYFAEAGSRGRTTVWYDPDLRRAARLADEVPDGSGWVALMRDEGASDVIVRRNSTREVRLRALERAGARRFSAVGPAEWWRMPEAGEAGR